MMNYAGMLVEARGRSISADNIAGKTEEETTKRLIQLRLDELKKAEALYSRAAAHGNVLAQQQPMTSGQGAGVDQASGPTEVNIGKEMAAFASEALGKVQQMIQAIVVEAQNKPQSSTKE